MNDQAATANGSLYARQEKIYAREVQGRFTRLRRTAAWTLLGIYYLLPWIPWHGRQAVLFDLPARQFHLFGLTLFPQDFFFLSWLLIMAALLLFLSTAVAGRVWCGYACPQTVWTEAFVWMERITEGSHTKRRRLDKGPWTREKILRKTAKRVLWILFAAWTGFTFVGYFTPIHDLGARLLSFDLGPWETFWIAFYGLATYGNAGHLREQVCKYMCPYARFQSAMFDRDTLIVSYDAKRGEPRGSRKRGLRGADVGLGDCIDCNICVQVCPTGIDIRDGLQYECITCAACIDACDSVMDKMGYPRGLIRYTTQHALEGKPTRILRPRTIVYAGLLLLLFATFLYALAQRAPLTVDVIRDRNALYRELPGGDIETVYTVKLLNKREQPVRVVLEVAGLPGLRLSTDPPQIELPPASVMPIVARVRLPANAAPPGGHDIEFRARLAGGGEVVARQTARFIMPLD
ncbi:MAG: cytochrome c oxidase accessory protein CcoG [Gammaproteobacteria bacterium]|nr:MAG: cytochrome c oxidase accessory protein CcoG [Gammaproteobacteria bacterium]